MQFQGTEVQYNGTISAVVKVILVLSGHIPHVNVADSSAVLFCPIHWNMVLWGKNDEQPLIPALEIQCYELLGCRVNLPTSSWVALGAK